MNKKKNNPGFGTVVIILLIIYFLIKSCGITEEKINKVFEDNTFRIISSTSTSSMDEEIIKYGKSQNISIEIEHYGDIEIVDILNSDSSKYDAVWISNSIWLYMLDNSYLSTDSKSIVIDPVVLGITKSKAEELGLIGKDIYNKDILNVIKEGKLNYVMASVTKTNTGATSYLSFLNSLAGSPEVLTEDMLKNEELINNLKSLFKGVERVSGDEDYLIEMFLNGNYNSMINYESSLIKLNQQLESENKEPLYLIYPKDGVAINDMPFSYINNDSNNTENKVMFNKIQSFLTSDEMQEKMEKMGYRSWYGGIKKDTNKKVFNPEWGINTEVYLKDMKYPSKKVINSAINLYIEELRKPTHVVFCLDVSGSMKGNGMEELKNAMNYILDYNTASKDLIQFSKNDKISLITFNGEIKDVYKTRYANEAEEVINDINNLSAEGSTNIYDPSIKALEILKDENSNEYTKTVILMTDGYSNKGDYRSLEKYYQKNHLNIPIYSITFGSSSEYQLNSIAKLTNAKVFDGKEGLKEAFTEVRSYN